VTTTEHLLSLAVSAYYAGELDAGRRACERLLSEPMDVNLEHQVRANRTWYTQPLHELANCRYQRFNIEPAFPGWSLFNPTILQHRDRLIAIVRSSNYQIVDGRYVMPEADGNTIRTENLLVDLRPDLTVERVRQIRYPDYPKTDFPVDGMEDCRLRNTKTGIGVSATVRNVSPFDGRCRIATADLDYDDASLHNLRVLAGLQCQEHEKNWMPIEAGPGKYGGWLYAANHEGHAVTVDHDPDVAGAYQMRRWYPAPTLAKGFRGGGQVIAFRDGWLGLIHEVAHFPTGHRVYEHRLVWWDDAFRLARWSQPFAFRELRAIEFAAGLATVGDNVVMTFGVRDAEAWLVEVPAADVASLLNDPVVSQQAGKDARRSVAAA
jgi:hypothetical protein